MLVSAYVLYLAYGLIKDYGTASNQMLSLVAIIIFVIGGGLILATSAYKLITKDYDDGSEEEEGSGTEDTVCVETRTEIEQQQTEEGGVRGSDEDTM